MICKGEKGSCLMNAMATLSTEIEVARYDFNTIIPERIFLTLSFLIMTWVWNKLHWV